MKKCWFCLFFICSGLSCEWLREDPPLTVDDPIVIAAAQARLQQYIDIKITDCREDMLEQAEMKVDSIITELIEDYMMDTIYFPYKPERPAFPEKLKLDSSLIPKPIIDSLPSRIKTKSQPDSIKIMADTTKQNI